MVLTDVHLANYRSIRSISFPVRQLSVLVGANGVGKTNLYRALELVRAAATGDFAQEIAREGGLASVMWAGERRTHEPPRLTLRVSMDSIDGEGDGPPFSYEIEPGFPSKVDAAFDLEAMVKREALTLTGRRPVALLERKGPAIWVRNHQGARIQADDVLLSSETALAGVRGYPEIDRVREAITAWRFYHGFRTDAESPLRQPARAVTAPMLDTNGANLAAVFATLRHIRQDSVDLDRAIDHAFPGAQLDVPMPERFASFAMRFADMPKRTFAANELSDGTLQFLALMGALLAYRLPPLIALNEPETSLHPDMLPALARIIARAAERTQVWIVTHSTVLAQALADETGILPRQVIRQNGGTWLESLSPLGQFVDD